MPKVKLETDGKDNFTRSKRSSVREEATQKGMPLNNKENRLAPG